MSENEREVYRTLHTSQSRYTYFLLTAAGAGIVLAINQTQDAGITWSQLPLAAGVLSWALSFFYGCLHLVYVNSTLYANAELLKVEGGQHPEVGEHPQLMAAASEGIRQAIENNSNRANRLGHLQFGYLVAGAVLFIGWHVLGMYLRGVS